MRVVFISFSVFLFLFLTGEGFAEEQGWRQEFARICAMTVEADQLSGQELDGLIGDSEKLLKVIKSKDDPDVKLYLIRLRKCRNFFIFMRDVSQSGGPQP